MCLIIVKKKGVPFNREELRQSLAVGAFRNNDGAGFSLKRPLNKKGTCEFNKNTSKFPIYLSKGYFDSSKDFAKDESYMMSKLDELKIQEEDELIVHLRFTLQQDTVNQTMCHPFVIPGKGNEKFLEMSNLFCSYPVFAHNGTFYRMSASAEYGSDTYLMAKKYFSSYKNLKDLMAFEDDQDNAIFKWFMIHNKLAILTAERDICLLGEFIEDGSYHYSNSYYKFTDGKSKKLAENSRRETV